jgi:hypothetical protein
LKHEKLTAWKSVENLLFSLISCFQDNCLPSSTNKKLCGNFELLKCSAWISLSFAINSKLKSFARERFKIGNLESKHKDFQTFMLKGKKVLNLIEKSSKT